HRAREARPSDARKRSAGFGSRGATDEADRRSVARSGEQADQSGARACARGRGDPPRGTMTLLGVAVGLALAVVSAEPAKRLAIMPSALGGDSASAPSADQLFESASRGARLRPGLEIVAYNELFVSNTDSLAGIVRDCGTDMKCASRALLL